MCPRPEASVRRAGPADAAALTEMLTGLSVRSAFFRFLTGLGRPSAALVTRLLRRDATHGAWLAVAAGQPVGHVIWVLDQGDVEIGVVVADAWQGNGIGGRLVQVALAEAAVAGGGALRADVHVENRRVVGMLRRALPGATVTREAELLTFRAPLRAAVPPAARHRGVLTASGA